MGIVKDIEQTSLEKGQPLIEWNEALENGIPEIDAQHQVLAGLFNKLYLAILKDSTGPAINKILDETVFYTKFHFGTEERYYEEFDYTWKDKHKQEHAEFIEKITAFQEDWLSGKLRLTVELHSHLSDWLKTHISVSDRKAGVFLRLFWMK